MSVVFTLTGATIFVALVIYGVKQLVSNVKFKGDDDNAN